jgi:DNA-binding response OmpR family regulator
MGVSTTEEVTILVATDDDATFDEVESALAGGGSTVVRVRRGADVRGAVAELDPELVICDLQIGNMGGVATALDLRLEEGAGRLEPRGILLLLDRADDEFIARRSGADGWIVKPLDSLAIRRGMQAVLAPASS